MKIAGFKKKLYLHSNLQTSHCKLNIVLEETLSTACWTYCKINAEDLPQWLQTTTKGPFKYVISPTEGAEGVSKFMIFLKRGERGKPISDFFYKMGWVVFQILVWINMQIWKNIKKKTEYDTFQPKLLFQLCSFSFFSILYTCLNCFKVETFFLFFLLLKFFLFYYY